jgi:hypothetical protein
VFALCCPAVWCSAVLLLSGPALQAPELTIQGPAKVPTLSRGFEFRIEGRHLSNVPFALTVADEVGPLVAGHRVEILGQDREDQNGDGLPERVAVRYRLHFLTYAPEPGGELSLQVQAVSADGPIQATCNVPVVDNLTVVANDAAAADQARFGLGVYLEQVTDPQISLLIAERLVDRTTAVRLSPIERGGGQLDPRGRTLWSAQHLELDLRGAQLAPGTELELTLVLTCDEGVRHLTWPLRIEAPQPVLELQREAVLDFLTSLGAGVGTDGRVVFGAETERVLAAAAQLRRTLQQSDPPLPAAGLRLDFELPRVDRHGQPTGEGAQVTVELDLGREPGGAAALEGCGADLVLALGAPGSSSIHGGSASASAATGRGCVLALAGDGGPGSWSPTDGGGAAALTVGPWALAAGGAGGRPVRPSQAGGRGGAALARSGAQEFLGLGGNGEAAAPAGPGASGAGSEVGAQGAGGAGATGTGSTGLGSTGTGARALAEASGGAATAGTARPNPAEPVAPPASEVERDSAGASLPADGSAGRETADQG